MRERALDLNEEFKGKDALQVLTWFLKEYKGRIALSSSMGAEDQVLTDMVMRIDPEVKIFTLDTGRLFYETYELIERTSLRYKKNIEIYFPSPAEVERMVTEKGINLFYQSIENRKECCRVRKIEPLKRAFKGLEVWICGLRRNQSATRTENQMVEWDEANGLIKLNPLIDWSEQDVWEYIKPKSVNRNKISNDGH